MFENKEAFKRAFVSKLESKLGRTKEEASNTDCYLVLGSLIREQISRNWIRSTRTYRKSGKQAYYFSMEFLLGRLMGSNLLNLGVLTMTKEALAELGFSLDDILNEEHDAGLGNGGLGRLAACFLDSLASLQLPGHGSGIRYKYGLFEQRIVEGYQAELPDYWLNREYVWEVRRLDRAVIVRFGGKVSFQNEGDRLVFTHTDYEPVLAVPYDVPIIGYDNDNVNTLRLWSAESPHDHPDNPLVKDQNYYAVLDYNRSIESISEFLYPDSSSEEGQILRLKQQYFLVSAGLQSILRSYKKQDEPITKLPDLVALHINDTHPTLLIPELMRILMDEEGLGWEEAWALTTRTVSYTNHTILSEALEKWPIGMLKNLLPRITMIIEEINRRFCAELWQRYDGDAERVHRMAIIADGYVHMAHLAIAGSYSVNGVAKLHTEILKKSVMRLFYEHTPLKFNNRTNGITHRRWLLHANPALAEAIRATIGAGWMHEPQQLVRLSKFAGDKALQKRLWEIKQQNKRELAKFIAQEQGIAIDPESIYDVHIKRLHGYKRQLLNAFHIMDLYLRLKDNPELDIVPRTFIFAGKAAPGYHFAKKVIKLINTLADRINDDSSIGGKIKVVFMENYSVSLAERLIPATDVSEQISTASKEASGTGNMKFMMNGALTIGTLDGANVEMAEYVGRENMFIFGLSAQEVLHYYAHGGYSAQDLLDTDAPIRRVLQELLLSEAYAQANVDFHDLYYAIMGSNDEYFVLKDFHAYREAQEMVDYTYRNLDRWMEKVIVNIAHSGAFSSDRTITEYAREIWDIDAVQM